MEKGGFLMSKRKLGITLTALALVILAVVGTFWYTGRNKVTPPEEQRGTELVEMMPAEIRPDQVAQTEESAKNQGEDEDSSPEESDSSEYEFVLVNNNNYVTVYRLPENEIYEYTDVIMDVLPVELQEEIQQGKYLRNEEELYNFLENYTS